MLENAAGNVPHSKFRTRIVCTSDTERRIEANFRAKRVERAAGRQGKAKGSIKRAEKPGVVQSKQNVVVVVSASYTPPSML